MGQTQVGSVDQSRTIDHIVFSSHQPGAEIKAILDDGKMDGVLMGVNILNFPFRWEGVEAAYQSGYGVVAMNPLDGGVIPANQDKFQFLAAEGETPVEAALRFIISCPQISVALISSERRIRHPAVEALCAAAPQAGAEPRL